MIINRSNLTQLTTGFQTIFNNAFLSGVASDYSRIAMDVPSTGSEEQYGWLGTTTRFREWLGDRVIQNLKTHDYTIKNISYEDTIGVDRDVIEDDKYGVYTPMIAQIGQDARQHPDELVFGLAAGAAAKTCYDGQYFFDTDHPVVQADGTSASVSNWGGGAGALWMLVDTSKMVKPFIFQRRRGYEFVSMDALTDEAVFSQKLFRYGVDARVNVGFGLWQLAYGSKQTLDAAAYNTAYAAMMAFRGDSGKPLGVRPNLLVVGPTLRDKALAILKAERDAAGATNINQNSAELLVTSWMA